MFRSAPRFSRWGPRQKSSGLSMLFPWWRAGNPQEEWWQPVMSLKASAHTRHLHSTGKIRQLANQAQCQRVKKIYTPKIIPWQKLEREKCVLNNMADQRYKSRESGFRTNILSTAFYCGILIIIDLFLLNYPYVCELNTK